MSDPTYECPDCGTENTIAPSVVDLCVEHWAICEECGERHAFNFRGAGA